MSKKYEVLKDSQINKDVTAGFIVYDCKSHDYGCSSDDTRMTGIEHISVTLNSNGDYPFFTIPLRDLKEIKDDS